MLINVSDPGCFFISGFYIAITTIYELIKELDQCFKNEFSSCRN